ncbi:MAG: recombinase family protein [Ruminococcus sp.]|nr:recombinase family protein [Ruminococcus sp.]
MRLQKQIKAIAYIRVSSEKQVENYSLDFQDRILKRYAETNNIKLVRVFREEGYSATNTNRPAYKEMIKYLEENDIDVILVHKLDRLHRDETNMFNDLKRFRESKIKVIAVADGIDTSDDSAGLATAMLAAIGANFSRNLSRETRKGLTSAAENCLHTGGKPPYGFKLDRETMLLEIDETTAPAVRKMFELYADGFGTSDIIKWLKEHGYKTAKGNDFKANALNEIFHNEKYRGCYTWDKALAKDADGHRNTHGRKDEYIKIEGGCPAIVSEEIFNKVQDRLKENANKANNRTPDRHYPLTGIIFCNCGSPMCGSISYSKGRRYHKYNCIKKCGNKPIRAEYIELFVINAISTCIFSKPNKELLLSGLNNLSNNTKLESDKEYQQLRSKLSGLETSHENLLKALEKGKASNAIMNRLERIEQEKKQTDFKIQNLTRDTHTFTEYDLQLIQNRFSEFLQFRNSINNKYFLRSVIDKIEVGEEQIKISLKGGISINKSTKILMKGNDDMLRNIVRTETKVVEGILLAIGSAEENGFISVKIALSTESAWSFGTILDITIPEEYLYGMAVEADMDVFEFVGAAINVMITLNNDKISNIDDISMK